MPNSVHGHDVLDLLDSPVQYTRDTLLGAMKVRFGADARFHTCSAQDMTGSELLDMLGQRGKFEESNGFLKRKPGSSCQH